MAQIISVPGPTQAQFNTLSDQMGNAKFVYLGTISANESKDYTVEDSTQAVLFTFGGNTARFSQILVNASSSGSITAKQIVSDAAITFATATNKLTVTYTSTSAIAVYAIIFTGNVS